jgi:uncharacterized membrane protein
MTSHPTQAPAPEAEETGGRDWTTIAAGVGAAVNAGVFLCFSVFIMPAVRDLPAPQGIEAMQAFNRTAVVPFTLVGLGTAVVCVVVIVRAFRARGTARSRWMLGGAAMFLIAAIVVTFVANVPISAAIDALDATSADAGPRWADLYTRWVWTNHLRTVGSLAAAVVLATAASRPRR